MPAKTRRLSTDIPQIAVGLSLACCRWRESAKFAPGVQGVATPRTSGGRDRMPLGLAPWMSLSALCACPEQMKGSKSRMQGKGSPERSAAVQVYAGIDGCKARLDVFIHPQ